MGSNTGSGSHHNPTSVANFDISAAGGERMKAFCVFHTLNSTVMYQERINMRIKCRRINNIDWDTEEDVIAL